MFWLPGYGYRNRLYNIPLILIRFQRRVLISFTETKWQPYLYHFLISHGLYCNRLYDYKLIMCWKFGVQKKVSIIWETIFQWFQFGPHDWDNDIGFNRYNVVVDPLDCCVNPIFFCRFDNWDLECLTNTDDHGVRCQIDGYIFNFHYINTN